MSVLDKLIQECKHGTPQDAYLLYRKYQDIAAAREDNTFWANESMMKQLTGLSRRKIRAAKSDLKLSGLITTKTVRIHGQFDRKLITIVPIQDVISPMPRNRGNSPQYQKRPTINNIISSNIQELTNVSSAGICMQMLGEGQEKIKIPPAPKATGSSALRKSLSKKVKPRPSSAKVVPTKMAQKMLDYWNSTDLPSIKEYKSNADKKRGIQTKRYQRVVKLLGLYARGIIYNGKQAGVILPLDFTPCEFDRPTLEDFKWHVDVFRDKAFESGYYPTETRLKEILQKTHLELFLAGSRQSNRPASLLRHAMDEPKEVRTITPLNKKLTDILTDSYEDLTKRSVLPEQFDLFTLAANRIHTFYHANRELFMFYSCMDPIQFLANYYLPALKESWGPNHIRKMGPQYLACPKPIERDVVKLLLDRRTVDNADELDMSQ